MNPVAINARDPITRTQLSSEVKMPSVWSNKIAPMAMAMMPLTLFDSWLKYLSMYAPFGAQTRTILKKFITTHVFYIGVEKNSNILLENLLQKSCNWPCIRKIQMHIL